MIFTRLTFNTRHWEVPMGHPWKVEYRNRNNIPFENQFGLGHEEWLFNTRYYIQGYQYGYIRGIRLMNPLVQVIDRVYLYSIRREGPQRIVYYIGHLNNVQRLAENWQQTLPEVALVYAGFEKQVLQEIADVGADPEGLRRGESYPVVRFRLEDAILQDEPKIITQFPLGRFKTVPALSNDT